MSKPPYRVPSMSEISAIPWNGFNVVSTFSGCGGSCLGYRMAGFRVLWANEFIPAAQESYRANAPGSILDGRDIRLVKPEEILEAVGMKPGDLDLFDGSPPCQAFSTAGKREKGWGHAKAYENGASQCNETLFDEYIRLLRGLQPKVFVAENVSGLVKGTAKGYFKLILAALKDCGYRVVCRVLDAQWLGVPQIRQRVIFIGVRSDLKAEPAHPKPLSYRYSVRDALPWIIRGRFGNNGWQTADQVSPTVSSQMTYNPATSHQDLELIEAETDISRYAIGAEWDKLKPGEQSEKYYSCVKVDGEQPCNSIMASSGSFPSAAQPLHPTEKRKFSIAELKRICAFPDDFVLTGSYSDQWARLGNAVPPVMMFHIAATVRDKILRSAA
jgi:DNA (cytosine-5)-methyltransferase 1